MQEHLSKPPQPPCPLPHPANSLDDEALHEHRLQHRNVYEHWAAKSYQTVGVFPLTRTLPSPEVTSL